MAGGGDGARGVKVTSRARPGLAPSIPATALRRDPA